MTETLHVMDDGKEPSEQELQLARELVAAAREQGAVMSAPGMLKALTKTMLETALDEEITEHLGYDKHQAEGRGSGNSRNGARVKTVITETVGPVQIEVPRDRDGSFDPQIVRKHQRRLNGVDEIVLSLAAQGLTSGDIVAHFDQIYGASISKDTISRITDKIVEEMNIWFNRPLEPVYVAVFIDALQIKVRDGQVTNRPFYAAIGVDLDGHKDVLGLWAGEGAGESAKFWYAVLTNLKSRGVSDVFFLVCDGLKGLPASVAAVWPDTIVQTCVVHLLRNSFKYVPRQHWDALERDLKPIYTAVDATAAGAALEVLDERWGQQYPTMIRLWKNAWDEFIPFLDYNIEVRRVLYSTNAIESLNARYRRAVKARGHFPTEQAALKTLYLVTRALDPSGRGQNRWAARWKPALNAFAITFAHRIPGLNRDQG